MRSRTGDDHVPVAVRTGGIDTVALGHPYEQE
jgi:hypothetical protein